MNMSGRGGFSSEPALMTIRPSHRHDRFYRWLSVAYVLVVPLHLAAVVVVDGYRDRFDYRTWTITIFAVILLPAFGWALVRLGGEVTIARITASGIERPRAFAVAWSDCTGVSHSKTLRHEIAFLRIHRRGRRPIRFQGLFEEGTAEEIAAMIVAQTGLPNLGFRRLDLDSRNVAERSDSEEDQDSEA